MRVSVLHITPLEVIDKALVKCWDSECKTGDDMVERIDRIANKNKHQSIIEHCTVNYNIEGISRALLQEVARHRMSSFSVESSRYVLKKHLAKEEPFIDGFNVYTERAKKYIVMTGDNEVDYCSILALNSLRSLVSYGKSNDVTKYTMPEAMKTNLVWTINLRSLANMLELRTDKSALLEFRTLAHTMFDILPHDYKTILQSYVKEYND